MNKTAIAIFQDITKKINNNSLHLASLPDIIIKVNAVLADDSKSMNDIVKTIQGEIALSARVIRIANSPALRGTNEIQSMSDAINRLGIDLIKNLAICVSLKDKFSSKNIQHQQLMENLMHLSMRRSVYGFMVAKYLSQGVKPELSLITGLVSMLGHMIILRYIDDTKALRSMSESEVQEVLDLYGDALSEMILTKWGFPLEVVTALFVDINPNIENPSSYRDVYGLTNAYLDFIEKNKAVLPQFIEINAYIDLCRNEFDSLETLLQ